jgi:hypothetical protein
MFHNFVWLLFLLVVNCRRSAKICARLSSCEWWTIFNGCHGVRREAQRHAAFVRARVRVRVNNFHTGESGVALRLPPQFMTRPE